MPHPIDTILARLHGRHVLMVVGLAGIFATFTVIATVRGNRTVARNESSLAGAAAVTPAGLDDLVAASSTILMGHVVGQPTIETVTFGQSSPLGENQTVHDLTLDIATYEVRVERCVAGSCPQVVQFKDAVDHENPPLVEGTDALFFVTPSISSWGTPGFASHYGRQGLLVSQNGTVAALAPDGGAAAQFLKGESLDHVASRAATLARGSR